MNMTWPHSQAQSSPTLSPLATSPLPHNKNTCLIVMGQAEQFLARRCDFSFGHRRAAFISIAISVSVSASVSLALALSVSSCLLGLGATVVSTSAKAAKAKKATRAACNCKSGHTVGGRNDGRAGWKKGLAGAGPVERGTTHRLRSVAFIKNFV